MVPSAEPWFLEADRGRGTPGVLSRCEVDAPCGNHGEAGRRVHIWS